MSSSEKQKLLNDVLEDANYQTFRRETELLGRTEFRRTHQRRLPVWLPLAASLVLGAVLILNWRGHEIEQVISTDVGQSEIQLQVPQLDRIRSGPLNLGETVRSTSELSLLVETRHSLLDPRNVVSTDNRLKLQEINDVELLAALPGRPAGFVQRGSDRQFILFLDLEPENPGRIQ